MREALNNGVGLRLGCFSGSWWARSPIALVQFERTKGEKISQLGGLERIIEVFIGLEGPKMEIPVLLRDATDSLFLAPI